VRQSWSCGEEQSKQSKNRHGETQPWQTLKEREELTSIEQNTTTASLPGTYTIQS